MGRKKKLINFVISENGCFECNTRKITANGYPSCINKKSIHRFIYEECFGEIPEGYVVRHKCDNRKCINPEHFEIGTFRENNLDTVERGRLNSRTLEGKRVLTDDQVREIRSNLKITIKEFAKRFKVGWTTIRRCRIRETYKDVPDKASDTNDRNNK